MKNSQKANFPTVIMSIPSPVRSVRLAFFLASLVLYMYHTWKLADDVFVATQVRRLEEIGPTDAYKYADPTTPTDTSTDTTAWPCTDFFSVLPNDMTSNSTCMETLYHFHALLSEHNEHMQLMDNSTLYLFTTWTPQQLQEDGCHLHNYSNLKMVQFDPPSLLRRHGFSEQLIHWMDRWGASKDVTKRELLTRWSDIFRILLAKDHRLAYADLDLIHLSNHSRVYLSLPNIAVPIWAEGKGALEIQNSGFCLTPAQLDVMIHMTKQRIQEKGRAGNRKNEYYYTELGPNVFQHAFPRMQMIDPIRLYYTQSNEDFNVHRHILPKHKEYARDSVPFVWLHLDTAIRRRMRIAAPEEAEFFRHNLQALRDGCPPAAVKELKLPESPRPPRPMLDERLLLHGGAEMPAKVTRTS